MADFKERYGLYAAEFGATLGEFCNNLNCKPPILAESMLYSLKNGGKRIRPVLMYAVGDLLGVDKEKFENFALALELIHTYSLIHDDLPEMDNDDFRRGKPSNHKVFGAGNAVLAGDGLLNTAYSIILRECRRGEKFIAAGEYICNCAGINGMIGGQSADMLYENSADVSEEELGFIYENKTAKMIMAACLVPSILCGGKYYSELKSFGHGLGCLFQLTDDILDNEGDFKELGKSVGKDKKEGKCTAVGLFGTDGAKLRADILAEKCEAQLEGFQGDFSFLAELTRQVRYRNK